MRDLDMRDNARAAVNMEPSTERVEQTPELRVESFSDERCFRTLAAEWDRLAEAAGIDHPFLTRPWVRSTWECFGGGRLRILVVREGTRAIALVPMMLVTGRMYGVKVRRLQFIANDHTQRFDFLVAHGAQEAYRAIWRHLLDCRDEWDVIELRQLPESSPTLAEVRKLAEESGFLTGVWPSAESPYLSLEGRWEEYFNTLRAKHRSNLRNRERRLSRLGDVEMEEVSSGIQVESALRVGLELEAAGWKGRAGTAIRSHRDLELFYRRLSRRAARRGWLRLHFLKMGSRRIAFDYSLRYGNKLYLLKPAYDPTFAAYSPYNLLLTRVLQSAFREGLSEFDFLGQNDGWKQAWTGRIRRHCWLFIYQPTRIGRLLHSAKFRLIPALKRNRLYVPLRGAMLGARRLLPGAGGLDRISTDEAGEG